MDPDTCSLFNTATVRSKISYIDGDKGILRYRGYPIEQLAEKSSFLEVRSLGEASAGTPTEPVVLKLGGGWRAHAVRLLRFTCS